MKKRGKMSTDIVEIIQGLKSGDDKAQADFWQLFMPKLLPLATRMLGNDVDALDMTVDALTDFMTKYVHQLSTAEAAYAYLRFMIVRRSIDLKKKRAKAVPLDFDVHDTNSMTPEEAAGWRSMMPQLNRCLERLTPKAKLALRLKYGRQLTNEKIGQLLGGSKQYMGRLIGHSLEALRRCIEKSTIRVMD